MKSKAGQVHRAVQILRSLLYSWLFMAGAPKYDNN